MKPLALFFVPAALAVGGLSLHTRYDKDTARRIEIEMSLAMDSETKMERDGQPVEGRGGMGGSSSDTEYKEVIVDQYVDADGAKPAKVKRHFEELGGTRSMSFGEEERSSDIESPIEGLVVMLSGDDGDVTAEVVDGKKPEDEKAFEKQRLALFIDGALPGKDVEEGASWDLTKEQVLSILHLDTQRGLYPPPPREGGEGGGEGGRPRGGRMGGGGGDLQLLLGADWKGKAKLAEAEEEVGGVKCAVIELEFTASGELPMPEMRAGGRRERMFAPEFELALGNSYEIELEGKLAFDLAAKRPQSLTIEGKLSNTLDMEREGRDGGTMKIHTERSGKFKLEVKVSDEKPEKK